VRETMNGVDELPVSPMPKAASNEFFDAFDPAMAPRGGACGRPYVDSGRSRSLIG